MSEVIQPFHKFDESGNCVNCGKCAYEVYRSWVNHDPNYRICENKDEAVVVAYIMGMK